MSYPSCTKALICYIEAHIMDGQISYGELEKQIQGHFVKSQE